MQIMYLTHNLTHVLSNVWIGIWKLDDVKVLTWKNAREANITDSNMKGGVSYYRRNIHKETNIPSISIRLL